MKNRTQSLSLIWTACVLLSCSILIKPHLTTKEPTIASSEQSEALIAESAFESSLYFHRQEPYRSYTCRPKRIHLSQASDSDDDEKVNITVSFSLPFRPCRNAIPTVHYGSESGAHNASTPTPQHFNFTSSAKLYESDWIFHVQLPNLMAGGREYWYRITIDVPDGGFKIDRLRKVVKRSLPLLAGESPTLTFRTPPLRGSPTTIALVGDLGQTFNSTKTMSKILNASSDVSDPVSLVLIAGDMSYADSNPKRWESWFDLMEPLLRKVPVHVAAGNHEIECDELTGDIFVPYENWFHNPNRIGRAEMKPVDNNYRKKLWRRSCSTPSEFMGHYNYGNAFYAFQHGLSKMIILSSYSDTSVGSVQYQWLEKELDALDRLVTPWLIVSFHCPFYTTFNGHVNEKQVIRMKEAMEPLFIKYKVNIVVSGHDHGYLRTLPMANGIPDPYNDSPVYVTVGAGGNREGHVKGFRHRQPEAWVAKRDRWEFGYTKLHIANASDAMLQWVRDGTSSDGIYDCHWLENHHINSFYHRSSDQNKQAYEPILAYRIVSAARVS